MNKKTVIKIGIFLISPTVIVLLFFLVLYFLNKTKLKDSKYLKKINKLTKPQE
jgi:hypothetical protein